MRIAMGVEYNGAAYCGWQYQDHSPSVQEVVEKAISTVANHPVRVACAGRTDTGVHATAQVIHFDTESERESHQWVFGCNTNLPRDVVITWSRVVDDEFHARFSAERRSYRYIIYNHHVRPAILDQRVSWERRQLDEKRMQLAAKDLLGEHDFNSYRALACQAKSPVRTLHRLDVQRSGQNITLDLEANGFLHHMVRNIAGVLIKIGCGEAEVSWAKDVLELRDRTQGGVTAPPGGLYLTGVSYPDQFAIPDSAINEVLPVV